MNRRRVNRTTIAGMAALLVVLAGGCNRSNPNRGTVSGKVTLDGQPLECGVIQFVPIDGTQGIATGGSIEKGLYRLADAAAPAVGRNRVEIRAMRPTGNKVPKPFAPPGEMIDELVAAVPPQYNSNSKLTVEVKPGENAADFAITAN